MRPRCLPALMLPLVLALLLGACAERWAKPGGTPQAFEATRTRCEALAYRTFPPLVRTVQASPGYFTPARQICHGRGYGMRCYLEGGFWVPPQYATVDDNGPGRRQQARALGGQHLHQRARQGGLRSR